MGTPLSYVGIGALILSTLLTTLYMMTIVIRAYFPMGEDRDLTAVRDPNGNMTGPLLFLTAVATVLALSSAPLNAFVRKFSARLF